MVTVAYMGPDPWGQPKLRVFDVDLSGLKETTVKDKSVQTAPEGHPPPIPLASLTEVEVRQKLREVIDRLDRIEEALRTRPAQSLEQALMNIANALDPDDHPVLEVAGAD